MRRRTSPEWIDYFDANDAPWEAFDWTLDAGPTHESMPRLIRSLQAWQLGETSEARQLRNVAKRYAFASGDIDFAEAMDLFIREEQRHGEALGRYLDAVGAARLRKDLGDSLFRYFRHALKSLEAWTTIVVMIETVAMVYYAAVRRAIPSPLLKALCTQILRDEVPHLRFQTERLASFYDERGKAAMLLTLLVHRIFFTGMVAAVWIGHHAMLQAGGHTLGSFWTQTWRRMRHTWRAMEPQRDRRALRTAILRRRFADRTAQREAPSRLEGWLH